MRPCSGGYWPSNVRRRRVDARKQGQAASPARSATRPARAAWREGNHRLSS